MNNVNLIGNLTRDPELRTTANDKSVSDLRVAINRPKRDGEDQAPDYVTVTVWGATAENCARYLAKGSRVAITGRLEHSEWDSENGHRQELKVVANQVDFLTTSQHTDAETDAEEVAA